jgi:hypothetical protein
VNDGGKLVTLCRVTTGGGAVLHLHQLRGELADVTQVLKAFRSLTVMAGCFMRAPPPPADDRQTRGRNRGRGKACGVFVPGATAAEHTDTGFTVCATNGGKHKDKLRV